MSKEIGILHLSDIHMAEKSATTISRLIPLLLQDVAAMQAEHDTKIRAVCITGDLISSGDQATIELNMVLEQVIDPLMKALDLTEDSFFVVPGNHEVQKSEINKYVETGLEEALRSETEIDALLCSKYDEEIKRVSYFDNDFASMFGGARALSTPLFHTHIYNTGEMSLGIACLNSSWRSTGVGLSEKGKMVLGRKQIIDSISSIEKADIKICMMHHPLDWFVDDDKNAVEKCINQFDIVLNGHIHENSSKIYTTFNGQTLFNTCGKFDNSSDIYNGYSIVSINPYNQKCKVILRQYLDYPRNCFDRANSVAENGVFSLSLGSKDKALSLAYNITHSIEKNFSEYANSFFVANVASGKVLKTFGEAFIPPLLSRFSEYEKETEFNGQNDEEITLEELCNKCDNVVLFGKKESGKTTVLHYIMRTYFTRFNELKTVPILLDCTYIDFAGKASIEKAILRFINEYCEEGASFSKNDIQAVLEDGRCTILFDNYDTVTSDQHSKINSFLEKYENNRFIFVEREEISARGLRTPSKVPNCAYNEAHICSLTKEQIREITHRVQSQSGKSDETPLVDKILLCFKKTSLPKTPFVLSLILSLCDNTDFVPINEATVLEQFMERLLEKTSPAEIDARTFDFKFKEDFLIYLVSLMHEKNNYYFSEMEFFDLVQKYHVAIGFEISETGFDSIFFRKGVLIKREGRITFRYSCMVEYYLAKRAKDDPQFLNQILYNKNYLNYASELLYYTGLNRKNSEILQVLEKDLMGYFELFGQALSSLCNYSIDVDIALPEKVFVEKLEQSRLSQHESDEMSDTKDNSERVLPETIDKKQVYSDGDAFFKTLQIYGSCIKNQELLPQSEKIAAFENYLTGLCIMLAILKLSTEEWFDSEIAQMENLPEEFGEEEIKRIRQTAKDVLMISLPIAVQNFALENIGTTKLKSSMDTVINKLDALGFKKFFAVFMMCDLRLSGVRKVMQQYANNITDKSLLKIIFFKIMYYYQIRYFSPSMDSFLENLLADINIRLNDSNKFMKTNVIKKIQDGRQNIKA